MIDDKMYIFELLFEISNKKLVLYLQLLMYQRSCKKKEKKEKKAIDFCFGRLQQAAQYLLCATMLPINKCRLLFSLMNIIYGMTKLGEL